MSATTLPKRSAPIATRLASDVARHGAVANTLSDQEALAASQRLSSTDIWIEVRLPKESQTRPPFNRASKGIIRIMRGEESVVGPYPCLGKGGGSRKARSFDWRLRNNDTPTGEYLGHIGRLSEGVNQGPFPVIRLEPIGGNALLAARAGRAGFAIHGGEPNTLWATHGCVRTYNEHQQIIIAFLQQNGKTKDIIVEIIEE